jgi:hypothetical protein
MNLAEILSQGESEGVEFKSSFSDEAPDTAGNGNDAGGEADAGDPYQGVPGRVGPDRSRPGPRRMPPLRTRLRPPRQDSGESSAGFVVERLTIWESGRAWSLERLILIWLWFVCALRTFYRTHVFVRKLQPLVAEIGWSYPLALISPTWPIRQCVQC